MQAVTRRAALFSSVPSGSSLAARWIGLSIVEVQHLTLGTASVSVLTYNPARPDLRVITHWNHAACIDSDLARRL